MLLYLPLSLGAVDVSPMRYLCLSLFLSGCLCLSLSLPLSVSLCLSLSLSPHLLHLLLLHLSSRLSLVYLPKP